MADKQPPDQREPALALRFSVSLGGITIERFTQVDGLTAEYEVEEWKEGGQGGFVHRLPVRVKYTNVRMIRPIDRDSAKIAAWFSQNSKAKSDAGIGAQPWKQHATVTAYDGDGRQVAAWVLADAWPVKYTGPNLMSTSALAATETLEISHTGFVVEVGT